MAMPDERALNGLSLQEIEGDDWGDPPADATRLIRTAYQLRRTPLDELDAEDLRLLIAQKIGLDVLVPRTLTLLEQDPLLEGDFYPGDVLAAVLKVPPSYWSANPAQLTRIERVIASLDNNTDLDPDIAAFRTQSG
jgi:CDI immunity proteins